MSIVHDEKIKLLRQKLENCHKQKTIEWPRFWSEDNKNYDKKGGHLVLVVKDTEEYNFVKTLFLNDSKGPRKPDDCNKRYENKYYEQVFSSLKDFKIEKIERVENPQKWYDYYTYVKILAAKYDIENPETVSPMNIFEKANEWWTKHGARKNNENIISEGFDMRYGRVEDIMGGGIYTSAGTGYSHDAGFVTKLPDNKYQIFLCRFAAGKMKTVFTQNKNRAFGKAPEGFDSTCSIGGQALVSVYYTFVHYDEDGVYPAYLITYSGEQKNYVERSEEIDKIKASIKK